MTIVDLDARRENVTKWAKYSLIAIGAALSAPLAFLALEGLVAWGAFALVLFLLVNFAPVFATWVANKHIQALVAAVEANPIETMQNLFAEKSQDLADADRNITSFDTEIRNFDDQVDTFKQQYLEEAPTYVELSTKMHDALAGMKIQQTEARKELAKFQQQIAKAQAIYRMSLAASKVVQLSKSAEAQVFAKIKEQVAFDTVRTSLNQAFANLDLALERRNDSKAFTMTPPKELAAPPLPEVHVMSTDFSKETR